ncbi:MAG: amidohydrolase, partial [Nocardioides sp.]
MGRILFAGGGVFDGRHHREDTAVLIEDGRVVAVGEAGRAERAGAEVVDLAGGLVSPGFVDAHVHTVQGGL